LIQFGRASDRVAHAVLLAILPAELLCTHGSTGLLSESGERQREKKHEKKKPEGTTSFMSSSKN
jgi:hypothetical protein